MNSATNSIGTPPTVPAVEELFAQYRAATPPVYDELLDAAGTMRPHWRGFVQAFRELGRQ